MIAVRSCQFIALLKQWNSIQTLFLSYQDLLQIWQKLETLSSTRLSFKRCCTLAKQTKGQAIYNCDSCFRCLLYHNWLEAADEETESTSLLDKWCLHWSLFKFSQQQQFVVHILKCTIQLFRCFYLTWQNTKAVSWAQIKANVTVIVTMDLYSASSRERMNE